MILDTILLTDILKFPECIKFSEKVTEANDLGFNLKQMILNVKNLIWHWLIEFSFKQFICSPESVRLIWIFFFNKSY